MSGIKTPELQLAGDALVNLLRAADKGIADIQQGRLVVGASNGMCRVVKTDVDRRLAAPKLAAIEQPTEPRRSLAA